MESIKLTSKSNKVQNRKISQIWEQIYLRFRLGDVCLFYAFFYVFLWVDLFCYVFYICVFDCKCANILCDLFAEVRGLDILYLCFCFSSSCLCFRCVSFCLFLCFRLVSLSFCTYNRKTHIQTNKHIICLHVWFSW